MVTCKMRNEIEMKQNLPKRNDTHRNGYPDFIRDACCCRHGEINTVYTWVDIDLSISSYTPSAWKIPGLEGSIRSVSFLSKSLLVCATEPPLESLCKDQDMFVVPTVVNGNNLLQSNDSDILVPKKQISSQSVTGTLLNLSRNPQSVVQEISQLVTIQLRENRDPQRKSCIGIGGLLSPEILIYEPSLRSLVVGSNTQNVLQVFTFTRDGPSGDLVKSAEIQMDKLERPKGISLIPKGAALGYKGILIAAGMKKNNDSTFLPSSSGSNMEAKLKFYSIDVDLRQFQSDLNESADSSESLCSSLSSIESPRQGFKIKMDLEQTESSENLCEKDQNENSVPKLDSEDMTAGADLYFPKQKTRTELCDPSDTDSEASPREVTPNPDQNDNSNSAISKQSDTDSNLSQDSPETPEEAVPKIVLPGHNDADSDASPRDITLFPSTNDSSRPKIEDLSQSISVESDLETEKVDFSEQEPRFRSSVSAEDIFEGVDEVAKNLESRLVDRTNENMESCETVVSDTVEMDSDSDRNIEQLSDRDSAVITADNARNANRDVQRQSDGKSVSVREEEESLHSTVQQQSSETEGQSDVQNDDESFKIEQMEQELQEQNKQISLMSEKVSKLAQMVDETTLVFPTKYQTIEKPETVLIVCRCPNKKTIRKTFLLDNGRLALDAIKASFNLDTVEIFIDGDPCTVSSNIDGYIPLRFQPSTTLIIQGRPSRSNPRIPSNSDSDEENMKYFDAETKTGTVC